MLWLFAATLCVSACLLFLVEPMFAKMALPLLGGTPAVWNTCMVFFQAALLAGYAYAHSATERLGARRQAVLQIGLLFLPLLLLPVHLRGMSPPADRNPIPWLLVILLVSVGLPFFTLSTITPTLQIWFANTGHRSGGDPYFLYSASNVGSMLALLGYPILIEPHLRLAQQSWLWSCGYGLLLVLALSCAVILWRSPGTNGESTAEARKEAPRLPAGNRVSAPTARQRLRWIALAFVPSSLMLGVTTILTTDIPPIPLFWVVPLAIYLLTFILVFAKKPIMSHRHMVDRVPFLILVAIIPIASKATLPVWMQIFFDLTMLFFAAMVCHGELASSRPCADHLTEFYLWMSAGGVLGGLFNAVLAPLVFKTVLEFPVGLMLLALLLPRRIKSADAQARWLDYALPAGVGLLTAVLLQGGKALGLEPGPVLHLLVFGPALILCLSFAKRPVRFTCGLGAILLSSTLYAGPASRVLETARSFFGVYRVTEDRELRFHQLFHGSTIHGLQNLSATTRLEPLSYYTRSGPIGQVFAAFSGTSVEHDVGIIGLGAGSMACYGAPGERFTFYEIDPVVERIARDPRYFTFLRDCPPQSEVVLGDARLSMRNAPDRHYTMIVLDAFSSDAVPMHLLTREALRLYLSKLADRGILAFNVSNRYLDLKPVLSTLARDGGLAALFEDDTAISETEIREGKFPSRWAVLARSRSDLGKLNEDARWKPLESRGKERVWTDDFSNILSIVRWD